MWKKVIPAVALFALSTAYPATNPLLTQQTSAEAERNSAVATNVAPGTPGTDYALADLSADELRQVFQDAIKAAESTRYESLPTGPDADSCCEGEVGDVTGDGGVTIADFVRLVEVLMLYYNWSILECLGEADINLSGSPDPVQDDISVGDMAALLEHLFMAGPLAACYSTSPFSHVDLENPDSVIAGNPVLSVTGGGLTAAVPFYMYDDAQDVSWMSGGFEWDNPKAYLDSAVWSPEASAQFTSSMQKFYKNELDSSNANLRFHMVGASPFGSAIAASPVRKLLITYYFSLTNWTPSDLLCITTVSFLGLRFVDENVGEYTPVWSPAGCTAVVDTDGDGVLNDGDFSGIAGDNPCQSGELTNCDDNCPYAYNPGQADLDGDGKGDVCEAPPDDVPIGVVTGDLVDLSSPVVADLDRDHYPGPDLQRPQPERHLCHFWTVGQRRPGTAGVSHVFGPGRDCC